MVSIIFFDAVLENYLFLENRVQGGDIRLWCAGVGLEEYSKWYIPQQIICWNGRESCVDDVPTNIAEGRIPMELVNDLASDKLQLLRK